MASYLVGIDIGGTFTDCVVICERGQVVTAKAPSTPGDYSRGVLDAITAAGRQLGHTLPEICRATRLLSHATTIGTNAVIEKRGARVGIITTKGHNDVIHIMRGSRGLSGRDLNQVVHFPESSKPDPLVPKDLIEGISERIDCFGNVVVPLNEEEARAAVRRLLERGVEAIAVSFLWSFKAPAHEQRMKAILAEMAPDVFVSCSSDLAPRWGEYERTTAAVLNAYMGPLTSGYLRHLERQFRQLGYQPPLQIAQCGGGTVSIDRAAQAPLLTLDSGPVAGVTGSRFLGELIGYRNVITTDMGGTSFDVGLIIDGESASSSISSINQYDYFMPKVDISVIGSGGGSLVDVDVRHGLMRVGPKSAGAVPGPICYGKGGTQVTVTDAALVLGYIDPATFAGSPQGLDREQAEAGIRAIATSLGMTVEQCAAGIVKIAEFQMADLIRKVTVQRGLDPRDYVVFAFGGAGPLHAGVFAFEAGAKKALVPQRKMASTWCAFGAAAADILHVYERVDIMTEPFDLARINRNLAALLAQAQARIADDGETGAEIRYTFSIDLRHQGQINEVAVVLPGAALMEEHLPALKRDFYERYTQLYGAGTTYSKAVLEAVTCRLRVVMATPKPALVAASTMTDVVPQAAVLGARPVYWESVGHRTDTPVFAAELLVAGNTIEGPAVLEAVDTTIVVHPGRTARVDAFGNVEISLSQGS
ncbi:MAG: hydantoinase/oxoprolinase family protein [Gammaproteobacteria bacterium]|nr:MAG: hydantoinase/oxoprolinase family protein [Gammaproteobacteria bacterium]